MSLRLLDVIAKLLKTEGMEERVKLCFILGRQRYYTFEHSHSPQLLWAPIIRTCRNAHTTRAFLGN